MINILPIDSSAPHYGLTTILDGVHYMMNVRWNGRDEAWYLDIMDSDEVPIRMGIKLVLGVFLGWRTHNPDKPNGLLWVQDMSSTGADATYDELGGRIVVVFMTGPDFVAAVADGDIVV